ncbi:hypothetical protein EDB83DRAFT_2670724 [Lactarius deliciosus]|nr:hypothetical protein EDB83DRAFT_2670724 [Lactarius deliciosus]
MPIQIPPVSLKWSALVCRPSPSPASPIQSGLFADAAHPSLLTTYIPRTLTKFSGKGGGSVLLAISSTVSNATGERKPQSDLEDALGYKQVMILFLNRRDVRKFRAARGMAKHRPISGPKLDLDMLTLIYQLLEKLEDLTPEEMVPRDPNNPHRDDVSFTLLLHRQIVEKFGASDQEMVRVLALSLLPIQNRLKDWTPQLLRAADRALLISPTLAKEVARPLSPQDKLLLLIVIDHSSPTCLPKGTAIYFIGTTYFPLAYHTLLTYWNRLRPLAISPSGSSVANSPLFSVTPSGPSG